MRKFENQMGETKMVEYIKRLEDKVMQDVEISKSEALKLFNVLDADEKASFNQLMESAGRIREKYLGKTFELCSIINAKSGKCSEDCTYCSQSVHYSTGCDEYGVMEYEKILKRAKELESKRVNRFSLVTSGRGIESEEELEKLCRIYEGLSRETGLKLCASHGIIDVHQAKKLKDAGVERYHHNIETSREKYGDICTTHTYEDRLETIKNANSQGLDICCGGIIGLGENIRDRVDMAFEIRRLGIKSIPLNILMPVKNTPLEKNESVPANEILATMAVFRFVVPSAHIRYAGGRMKLGGRQIEGIKSSVSSALVGDYLTTVGSNIDEDKQMIQGLGFTLE